YVDITGWIHGFESLSSQLKWAWHEVAVMERLFPRIPEMASYRRALRDITAASNLFLLGVVEDVSRSFSHEDGNPWSPEDVEHHRVQFLRELLRERNAFVERNQTILLEGLPSRYQASLVSQPSAEQPLTA